MRSALIALLLVVAVPGQAALVDNGSFTTDTVSGLDWLDLAATTDMNIAQVQAANPGWRLATKTEINDIFWQIFPNYYDTTDSCSTGPTCGTSRSDRGASADQEDRIDYFMSLFGSVPYFNSSGDEYLYMQGYYLDENGDGRIMGVNRYRIGEPNEFSRIHGMGFTWIDTTGTHPDTSSIRGTYMVRASVVPIPAAAWLFGSALLALLGIRRKAS